MRIAFVAQPFDSVRPPIQNSLGHWTHQMARRVAAAHDVRVYCEGGGRRFHDHREDGLHYRLVPMAPNDAWMRWQARRPAPSNPTRPRFARATAHLPYALAVAADLARWRPDGVHLLNFSQFVPWFRRASRRSRIFLHMQCEWLHQLDPALLRPRLARTDWIVGCSDYVAREAARAFPEHAARCRGIPNGVDVEHFTVPGGAPPDREPDSPRILYVGRVSPEKGVHVLLEAFERLASRFPGARLQIAGGIDTAPREYIVDLSRDPVINALGRFYEGGTYREHLEARLSPATRARVEFLGNLPQAELLANYRAADVFVLPSSCHEAFGMPLAEAMACGVPCVGTRAGGIPEVVADGDTGFVVEREDPAALADAIGRLLAEPALREKLGRAGRERARRLFSWDVLARALLALYEEPAPAAATARK